MKRDFMKSDEAISNIVSFGIILASQIFQRTKTPKHQWK